MDDVCPQAAKIIFNFSDLLLKYLRYKHTKTSSVNVGNIQPRIESLRHDPFFDPSPLLFGFRPTLGNHKLGSTNQPSLCFAAAATSIS